MGGKISFNKARFGFFAVAVCVFALGPPWTMPACAADFYRDGTAPGTVRAERQIERQILSGQGSDHYYLTVNNDGVGAGAQNFVQGMANRGIGFLSNSGLSVESKKASFKKLLQDSFDMKTIGRFSLGRYWRVATPQQRTEFQALFEKMVIEVYSQRFSDYKGQRFEARSHRVDGDMDTLVTSFIVPEDGPEIQVDWRVRYKNGSYKVVDIIVEGVSMSVTQRSDFSAVIQRGGGDVAVLLQHLRAQ